MDHRAKLKRAREIQAAIGKILLEDWDPIGIRDVREAQDEYDHFIGGVYRLLATGARAQQVAEHLCEMEIEWLRFTPPRPSDLLPLAEKLCALDVRLERE